MKKDKKIKYLTGINTFLTYVSSFLIYGAIIYANEGICKFPRRTSCLPIYIMSYPAKEVYKGLENLNAVLRHNRSLTQLVKYGYSSGMVSRKEDFPSEKRFKNLKNGFNFNYKRGENPNGGFILLSRANPLKNGKPIIELWDLNYQEIKYTWDLEKAIDATQEDSGKKSFYFLNPLILEDGSLVFNTQKGNNVLMKIDRFGEIKNINKEFEFHHSLNLDANGNIYACFNKGEREGYAILNQNLEIIEVFYIDDLYKKHNLSSRLFSSNSGDPIHINDVEPILNSNIDKDYQDLVLISLRSTSSIILYNQKIKKIISIFDGMVSQQHDVDVINTNPLEISIFDNNVLKKNTSLGNKVVFLKNIKTSQNKDKTINIYMPNSKQLNESNIESYVVDFLSLKEDEIPRTKSSGLSEYNQNSNSLIVEESNYGRIFEYGLDSQKINWTFINSDKNNKTYWRMSWSRFYKNNPIKF